MVKAAAAQAKKKQAKKAEGRLVDALKMENSTVDDLVEDNTNTSLGIELLFSASKLSETEVDA